MQKIIHLFSSAGVLLLGSLVGQATAILLVPLIASLYGPEEIGRAAATLASLGIIGLLITLQYEQAIIVAQDDELGAIVLTCLGAVCGITGVLVVIYLLQDSVAIVQQVGQVIGLNRYLVVLCFAYGLNQTLIHYLLRVRRLGPVGLARTIYYGGSAVGQVAAAYLVAQTYTSILMAQTIALICSVVMLLGASIHQKLWPSIRHTSAAMLKRTPVRYINYFRYQVGAQGINSLSAQLPVYLLRHYFGDAASGLYHIAYKVLAAPVTLLSQALGQVLFRDVAQEFREHGKVESSQFGQLLRFEIIAISFGVSMLYLWLDDIVRLVFDPEWLTLDQYIEYLLISFSAAFIVSPISTLLNVFDKQRDFLRYNVYLFLARVVGLYIGVLLVSAVTSILWYALLSLGLYLLFLRYLLQQLGVNTMQLLKKSAWAIMVIPVVYVLGNEYSVAFRAAGALILALYFISGSAWYWTRRQPA